MSNNNLQNASSQHQINEADGNRSVPEARFTPIPPRRTIGQFEWVIQSVLARSSRPAYWEDATARNVAQWLDNAGNMGIKAILCLLSCRELRRYYALKGIDLLAEYRARDLTVFHFPVADDKEPPIGPVQTQRLKRAFAQMRIPVLVHCSAGVDRTGAVVELFRSWYLGQQVPCKTPGSPRQPGISRVKS